MSGTLSLNGIRSILLLAAAVLVRQSPLATVSDVTVKEFCQWETFNVTCTSSQVLLVHGARYGRMHVGRCVAKNYGHVGCTVDVRSYIDGLCSGRQSCKFVVPDETLRSFQPCPKDFASYLEVSYSCIAVQTGDDIPCYGWQPIPIKATVDGYLANVITDKTGRGSVECPWLIRATTGQKVSITLLDVSSTIVDSLVVPESFAVPAAPSGGQGQGLGQGQGHMGGDVVSFQGKASHHCHKYAVVRERPSVGETVICGGHERERVVYLSSGHDVEVVVTKNISPRKAFRFLLHYRIIGCVALTAPANGWLELTDGDVLISGCNNTRERNYMRCEGSKWSGEYSNCSSDSTAMSWMSAQNDWSSPLGILLVSTIGVALGLVVGILLLLLVVLFFKRNSGDSSCLSPNSPTYVPAMHTDSSDFSRHQNPGYGSFVAPKHHRTPHHATGPPPPPPPPSSSATDKMELVAVGVMPPPPTSFDGSFWPYGSPPAYTPSTMSMTTETGTPGSAVETAGDHLLIRQGASVCRMLQQVDGDQAYFGRLTGGGGGGGGLGQTVISPSTRWSPAAATAGEFTECTYEFGTKRHIYESPKIPWPVIDELIGSEAEGVA